MLDMYLIALILVVVAAFPAYVVVKKRLYVQFLLAIVIFGACVSGGFGIVLLTDNEPGNHIAGALLLDFGLLILLMSAVAIKKFYFNTE